MATRKTNDRGGKSGQSTSEASVRLGVEKDVDSMLNSQQAAGMETKSGSGPVLNSEQNRIDDTDVGNASVATTHEESTDKFGTTNFAQIPSNGADTSTQQPADNKVTEGNSMEERNEKVPKDRSKLRKGKWTIEEEEYTSRIIQHFSAGLFILPEGATLRSYLAEKLNCDPMRITKKFTGACCLGRRVYHLRDRPRPTPMELDMAKLERVQLERRFRLRLEHEQSGIPLSRNQELLLAQPPRGGVVAPLFPGQNVAAPGLANTPWLSSVGGSLSNPLLSGNNPFAIPSPSPSFGTAPSVQLAGQWLQRSHSDAGIASLQAQSQANQPIQLLNNLVASWAVAQVAASLTPVLNNLGLTTPAPSPMSAPAQLQNILQQQSSAQQLADQKLKKQHEEHQRQLRDAFEKHKKEEEEARQRREAFEEQKRKQDLLKARPSSSLPSSEKASQVLGDCKDCSPADQLQRSYEAHLLSLEKRAASSAMKTSNKRERASMPEQNVADSSPLDVTLNEGSEKIDIVVSSLGDPAQRDDSNGDQQKLDQEKQKDSQTGDEEAGTILMGFLTSLRETFEDAIDETKGEQSKASNAEGLLNSEREAMPAAIKTSNQQPCNSVEVEANQTGKVKNNELNPGKTTKSPLRRLPTKRSLEKSDTSNREAGEKDRIRFQAATASPRARRPASVTDTSTLSRSETSSGASSTPNESSSSMEDSDSKSENADPSSGEESEYKAIASNVRHQSKGPPRKRLKASFSMQPEVQIFTKENLMEHSKRMNCRQKFDENQT